MNPLVWVVGGVALLGGGYLIYKFVQSTSPINQATALAKSAASSAESILNKDPVSVVSVGKDVVHGGESLYSDISGIL